LLIFLQQKVANSEAIVRQTWERYRTNNGGSMTTAIDQVLRNQYGTNLANEFPKFTWNNYFMITGTYDINVTSVYTDVATLPPAFTGPEWQLFRNRLLYPRKDWSGSDPLSNGIPQAGVLVERVPDYPNNNFHFPSWTTPIQQFGVAYTEFMTNTSLIAGGVLSVTIDVDWSLSDAQQYGRVSALPLTSFTTVPNTFLTPNTAYLPDKTVSRYTFRVADFAHCNRVALLINNLGPTKLSYTYSVEVVPPAGPIPPPCSLRP
jgi:hypothetical protein